MGILTCSSAEAVVTSLLPWGPEGYTSRQQRVPADSSRGLLSPAPCLSDAQKDRCQLFPARRDALRGACFSAVEAGALAGSLLAAGGSREARVLKCSSGKTPTGGLAATSLTIVPTVQLVGCRGQQGAWKRHLT